MSLEWIGRASAIVTIAGAAVSILWFCVGVSNRLDKLESQMQALATAPAVQRVNPDGSTAAIPNPIQQQCAQLAAQATRDTSVARGYTVDLMDRLGCRNR